MCLKLEYNILNILGSCDSKCSFTIKIPFYNFHNITVFFIFVQITVMTPWTPLYNMLTLQEKINSILIELYAIKSSKHLKTYTPLE